ncbi:erythromycin esterase family protein [Streptomyces sp. G44]|uniref:erythromycin esterase family protein n=1 Tax=Streptomyces sp. G44 TaxID=2807632 RepID=UPI0019606D3B|nr:erythromycin esterase family protein [Streptomyces sp. G44]MBM7171217.1 erythromycin esterase family protein [Streptomyces sp. G44]
MTGHRKPIGRRELLMVTAAGAATTLWAPKAGAATATGGQHPSVLRALERVARPLRSTDPGGRTTDLRALGAMVGGAEVVGLGEATHGSHEFFAMKERVFRHLVEEKGFTTFALEMSWTAGLDIDEYLQGGEGTARQVAEKTLAGSPRERAEFVSLLAWMREHNRRHPRRRVHFMGDDIGAPRLGDRIFERVACYVRGARPHTLPRLIELYAGLRPLDDIFAYLGKPLAERRRNAVTARRALELVTAAVGADGEAYEWAVRHARNIAWTFAFAALDATDPGSVTAAEQLRDRVMADNVAWWHRRTGGKVLLSAHNGHVGFLSAYPTMYPKTQGSCLRDVLGGRYLAIGFTFAGGSFLTKDTSLGGDWTRTTVPPAPRGMNEHTLDQVRHRDYYVDLRTAPPPARTWLHTARPTYDAGSVFEPDPLPTLALGRAYDVLIHLHRVREAEKL